MFQRSPLSEPSRKSTARPFVRCAAALVGMLGVSFAALADVTTVPPRFVVVLQNDVPLRCGDLDRFYRVGHLKEGTLLRVDGEGAGWLRVEYPAGSSAFVPASEAALASDGKTVRLTEPSRLRSANVVGGLSKSWKSLLEEPLAQGTELRVLEPVKDDAGTVVGYRVATPRSARAFLHSQFVRAATEVEARAYTPPNAGGEVLATNQPSRTPSENPNSVPSNEPAGNLPSGQNPGTQTPGTQNPGTQNPGVDESLLTPVPVEPRTPAADPQPADPASIDPTSVDPTNPATIDQGTGEGLTPEPKSVRLTLAELEKAYQGLIKQTDESAEFEELLEQFTHALAELEPNAINASLRKRVEHRINWIKFRIQTRDDLRRINETSEAGRAQIQEMRDAIDKAELAGGYSIVGRLSASVIYDGSRLPLLLAVRSIEGQPRTLAYIRITDQNRHILGMLGNVVGIVGEVRPAADFPTVREVIVRRIDTIANAQP
mgnify:CR=1 FL=1